MQKKIILIDQDGVLANFASAFHTIWTDEFREEIAIHPDLHTEFKIFNNYPEHLREKIESISLREGFFENLPPMEGAIEGVNEMIREGYEVFICTAPLSASDFCIPEKYRWIEKYFGREFLRRVIMTKDKTLVRGNILIDDRPMVEGKRKPEWTHILFDQPYNRKCEGPRMDSWKNWKKVINETLHRSH